MAKTPNSKNLASKVAAAQAAEAHAERKKKQRSIEAVERRRQAEEKNKNRAPRAWTIEYDDGGSILVIRPMGFMRALVWPFLALWLPVAILLYQRQLMSEDFKIILFYWLALLALTFGVLKISLHRFSCVHVYISSAGHYVVYRKNSDDPIKAAFALNGKALGSKSELRINIGDYSSSPNSLYKRCKIVLDGGSWKCTLMEIHGLAKKDVDVINQFAMAMGIKSE